jgi:hypothetical protein
VYVVADHQDRSSARISGCPQDIGYTTPENHKIQWLMTIFAINIGTFPRKSSDVWNKAPQFCCNWVRWGTQPGATAFEAIDGLIHLRWASRCINGPSDFREAFGIWNHPFWVVYMIFWGGYNKVYNGC